MNIPHSYQLFTAEGSRALDEHTISDFGIDGFTLMEIAGTRAADFMLQNIEDGSHGLVLCGKGNNAGDALVTARILLEHDIQCSLLFVAGTDGLSPDCQKNLDLLLSLGREVPVYTSLDAVPNQFWDFIVDGMLGTGLNSEVRGAYKETTDWANSQKAPVFSMDIPTGLNADSGIIMGTAIQADYTFAFGTLKQGFVLESGYEVCGEIIFCELPFPSKYKNSSAFLIDESWVSKVQPPSTQRKHKYDGGVVYIIAGSEGMTGAAMLAAKSAWATGVGAVILISPKGLLNVYEENLPQIIKKPVGEALDVAFKSNHIDEVQTILQEKPGILLVGPGLGRLKETISFTRTLLTLFRGKVVIDADGIFALSEPVLPKKPAESNWLLTPHPGELAALTKAKFTQGLERIKAGRKFAEENDLTLLSKGLPSVVLDASGEVLATGYDTRVFSRAGFGDVLAGKVAAFWLTAQNRELACCFALLDGKEKADTHMFSSAEALEPLHII